MAKITKLTQGRLKVTSSLRYTTDKDMKNKDIQKISNHTEINKFLEKVATMPIANRSNDRGRLIFALDATASRAATWDMAAHIQADMFQTVAQLGGLDIQLVYYHGYQQFNSTAWIANSQQLLNVMNQVQCLAGITQITKVLKHSLSETKQKKVQALVFIGDCIEESPELLYQLAGQLAIFNVPVFMFQEGDDLLTTQVFQKIASITKGAYCHFDQGSAEQLKEILEAVASYVAGGKKALQQYSKTRGALSQKITRQLLR